MTEPETTTAEVPAAWRLLLAGVAVLLILVTFMVQITQEAVIPPLVVLDVLFVVGLVLLVARPRIGAITLGVLAVLTIVVNAPFLASDITHPESFWSFVPSALALVGGLAGAAALVAVLRHAGPGPAGIVGAVVIAAVVGVVAVGAVSGSPEDDVKQEGDLGMFAQDFEFVPAELVAPAGDIGLFVGNDDLVRHNISIDELDVDEELPSKAYARVAVTGVEPGEYEYYCDIEGHEDMKGTLTVQ